MNVSGGRDDALILYVGRCIAAYRKAAGVTQAAVAGQCGLTRASIANIEAGRQEVPVSRLVAIALAIGATPAQLLPDLPSGPSFDIDLVGRLQDDNRRLRAGIAAARRALRAVDPDA